MTDAVEYPDLVVVGAGLFGLTVAQQAVEHLGARVEIIDVSYNGRPISEMPLSLRFFGSVPATAS